jgi:hypothetical protein
MAEGKWAYAQLTIGTTPVRNNGPDRVQAHISFSNGEVKPIDARLGAMEVINALGEQGWELVSVTEVVLPNGQLRSTYTLKLAR